MEKTINATFVCTKPSDRSATRGSLDSPLEPPCSRALSWTVAAGCSAQRTFAKRTEKMNSERRMMPATCLRSDDSITLRFMQSSPQSSIRNWISHCGSAAISYLLSSDYESTMPHPQTRNRPGKPTIHCGRIGEPSFLRQRGCLLGIIEFRREMWTFREPVFLERPLRQTCERRSLVICPVGGRGARAEDRGQKETGP